MKYTNWLAGTRNWLAGAAHHLCRPRRCRRRSRCSTISARSTGRDYHGGARLVCAAEVAAVLPAAARRPRARPVAGVALCGPRLLSASGRRDAARSDRPRGEAAGLRRCRGHLARCHPAGAGAARRIRRRAAFTARWTGSPRPLARRGDPQRAVAGGPLDRHARHELRAGPRSARRACQAATAARSRSMRRTATITTSSRAGSRSSPASSRPRAGARREGLRRHRAGHGKAAGRGRRPRLAGQAHQSGQPRVRLLAVPRHRSSPPPNSSPTRRRTTIAAPAAPASTSARPTPFRRPTGSMRGAASPTSPSRTRGRSRANSARRSATASMAATTASPSARGTSSRRPRPRRSWSRATICAQPALADLLALDDAALPRAVFRLAGQAHRPRPLPAQRADRRRQFRRRVRWSRRAGRCSTMRRRWCAARRSGRCRGCCRARPSSRWPTSGRRERRTTTCAPNGVAATGAPVAEPPEQPHERSASSSSAPAIPARPSPRRGPAAKRFDRRHDALAGQFDRAARGRHRAAAVRRSRPFRDAVRSALAETTHLSSRSRRDEAGDPVLAAAARQSGERHAAAALDRLSLDRRRLWRPSAAPGSTRPANAGRCRGARCMRVAAEQDWLALGRETRLPVAILRLSGIYGPGRNAFVNLANGTAQAAGQAGPGVQPHPCRRHRRRARGISRERQLGGIFNVTDDLPAPPQDVVAYAAELMGVAPPPEIPFETAQLSPMARSFYGENKRVSNAAIKAGGLSFRFSGLPRGLRQHVGSGRLARRRRRSMRQPDQRRRDRTGSVRA